MAAYPHFVEVSVSPPSGTMSAEMSFKDPEDARAWGVAQAKRLGLLGVAA